MKKMCSPPAPYIPPPGLISARRPEDGGGLVKSTETSRGDQARAIASARRTAQKQQQQSRGRQQSSSKAGSKQQAAASSSTSTAEQGQRQQARGKQQSSKAAAAGKAGEKQSVRGPEVGLGCRFRLKLADDLRCRAVRKRRHPAPADLRAGLAQVVAAVVAAEEVQLPVHDPHRHPAAEVAFLRYEEPLSKGEENAERVCLFDSRRVAATKGGGPLPRRRTPRVESQNQAPAHPDGAVVTELAQRVVADRGPEGVALQANL